MYPGGSGSPIGAMIGGLNSGNEQAQALLPSVYQPQGKAKPVNPYQGTIDLLVSQILELAHNVRQTGGDGFRDCSEKLLKLSYELTKVNNQITDEIQGDESSAGY